MSGTPAASALSRDDEERLSKVRAAELFDSGMLDELEPGTWAALSAIHRQLFCDVFSFAGELRDVDLSKGSMRFASRLYLSESVAAVERMPQTDFGEVVAKYVEMNVCHPFCEGNGRAMRIWLDHLLAHVIGRAVDWAAIETGEYLRAMERSPVCDTEIKVVLSRDSEVRLTSWLAAPSHPKHVAEIAFCSSPPSVAEIPLCSLGAPNEQSGISATRGMNKTRFLLQVGESHK